MVTEADSSTFIEYMAKKAAGITSQDFDAWYVKQSSVPTEVYAHGGSASGNVASVASASYTSVTAFDIAAIWHYTGSYSDEIFGIVVTDTLSANLWETGTGATNIVIADMDVIYSRG